MSDQPIDIRPVEFLPPILGFGVVLSAWAIDISIRGLEMSPLGLLEAHGANPLLTLIDLLPIGLLLVTWQLGRYRRMREAYGALETHHEDVAQRLRTEVQELTGGVFDGLIITGPDNRVVRCNPAASMQFGWSSEEMAGKTIGELLLGLDIMGDDIAEPRRTWRREVLTVEKRIQGRHKSGLRFPLAMTSAPFHVPAGVGTLFAIRDLGDQISQAETQLRLDVDPEALLPRNPTQQALEREKRVQAGLQRMRAPLASVLGKAADVRKGLEGKPEAADALTRIEGAGHTLLVQLQNMIDQFRIEQDEQELHVETVPIESIAMDAADAARSIARATGNWIETEIPEGDATCEVDQRAARDVLVNLLLNASQHTESGRIILRARRDQRGSHYEVVFEVEDPGAGMSGEALEAILYHPDAASPEIGLRVAKALAEGMSGELTVKSSPGAGTTASLRVQSKDKPTLVPARTRRWVPPVKSKETRDRNALVVGATPVESALIRDALEDHRWGVAEEQIEDALHTVGEARPDLVVFGFEQPQRTWNAWVEMKRHPILGLIPAMCVDNGSQARRAWTTRLASSPLDSDAIGAMASHLHASRIVPRAMLIERREFERNTMAGHLRRAGWWVFAPSTSELALELSAELPPELLVLGGDLGDGATLGDVIPVIRGVPATRELPIIVAPGRELTDDERTRAERANATILGASDPPDLLVVHATLALNTGDEGH